MAGWSGNCQRPKRAQLGRQMWMLVLKTLWGLIDIANKVNKSSDGGDRWWLIGGFAGCNSQYQAWNPRANSNLICNSHFKDSLSCPYRLNWNDVNKSEPMQCLYGLSWHDVNPIINKKSTVGNIDMHMRRLMMWSTLIKFCISIIFFFFKLLWYYQSSC